MNNLCLSDLKVGMRVSLSQIDGIVDVTIVLKKSSIDYSTGDPSGEIAFIGDDYTKVINPEDAVVIRNCEERDLWVD